MKPPIYQLIYALGTPLQGQPVTPALQYKSLDDARQVAQIVTRVTGVMVEVLEIRPVHATTVVANGNIIGVN